jgi:excisionase family DNA binding protein
MAKSSETSHSALSIQAAADRLGVHYMTMYRYVRLGLLPAQKVSGSWQVDQGDLEAFVAPSQTPTARGEAPWAERLEARMIAGDVSGAWSVVEAAMASGSGADEVYTSMLAPALASIGDKWADGDLGIEDEHLASAVAARLIGRMTSKFNRRGRTKGSIVVAMPSGDRHGFGLAMLADILRGAGYSVLDLGPDTPAESIVAAVHRTPDVHVVCLSVVYDGALPRLADTIDHVRSEVDGVRIIVGGRAIRDRTHALELGADGWAADADQVAALIHAGEAESRTA